MRYSEIDFARLYKEHLAQSERPEKPASDWGAKAQSISKSAVGGAYSQAFLAKMDFTNAHSLLDIGCGPGTIALPAAEKLTQVYALDYSQGMLDVLQDNARERQLDNIQPIHLSWEDDWADVPVCDIAVASRASIVADMQQALDKLNRHARQRVYMTHLVGGMFIDPDIYHVLGRDVKSFPDPIYVINLLWQQGIYPKLDYIPSHNRLAGCANFSEFASKVSWRLGELSLEELAALEVWYLANPQRAAEGGRPTQWAFLSWDVPSVFKQNG
ncbi:class I SAM-dependent methyltransferase [Pseudomonas sp. F1_0610]|uniref:class I SAM-dependent methyltransferase n=1 Tax=Pseudomonas sp. F1_0610 TaxID=3114284 RepID=UPI0039C31DAC